MPDYVILHKTRFKAMDDVEARRLAKLAVYEAENPPGCEQEFRLQKLQPGKPPKGLGEL